MREAQAKRSANSHIARLDVTLGLMSPTLPPSASQENANLSLERMIVTSEMKDFSDMVAFQGQICRVQAGKFFGTGFLIADDLVLTNYHVIEQLTDSDGRAIICHFDQFAKGRAIGEGRVALMSPKWLVACSPYAPGDGSLSGVPPTDQQLDFAILRLAESVGSDFVNSKRRGSIMFADSAPYPVKDDTVLILQYPPDRPLSMSIGTVMGYAASNLRIRYAASTMKGSSGSPVFASNLALVALHHAGDPNWSCTAEYNQGIPIGRITEWLRAKGIDLTARDPLPALSGPPPVDAGKVGSLVIVGEPRPPTPTAAGTAIDELLLLLTARGAPVTLWPEGWRDEKALSNAASAAPWGNGPALSGRSLDKLRHSMTNLTT